MWRRATTRLSCCPASTAPTRRMHDARFGKVPTTSVRRRISRFSRSGGLFDQICRQCSGEKALNARRSPTESVRSSAAAGTGLQLVDDAVTARGPGWHRTGRRSSARGSQRSPHPISGHASTGCASRGSGSAATKRRRAPRRSHTVSKPLARIGDDELDTRQPTCDKTA
jgi:hypothetical protein